MTTTLSDYNQSMLREEVLQERYDEYWRNAPMGEHDTDVLTETDQIKVEIENIYPDDGDSVTTHVVAAVTVPEGDDVEEWAEDQLFPLTGTGRTEGKSCHSLTITKFDARPDLEGREFEWGF